MKKLLVPFIVATLIRGSLLVGQAGVPTRLAGITVSITPSEVTLFAEETHSFAAMVRGASDKTVTWAINEENGGTINNLGLYSAPSIQGVYHVTATSKANPRRKAVATVTVLTYCDPPLQPLRQ